jgi:hypothetical protein
MFWRKDKHECDYKVLGVKSETVTLTDKSTREYSYILFKCACGDWYTDTINGKWSYDELSKLDEE